MFVANFEIWIAEIKFLMPIDSVWSLRCVLRYSISLRGKESNCSITVITSVPLVIFGTCMTLLNVWSRPKSFILSILLVVAISRSLRPCGGNVFKRIFIFSNMIFEYPDNSGMATLSSAYSMSSKTTQLNSDLYASVNILSTKKSWITQITYWNTPF